MNAKQREALLETLKARFEANMHRHEGLDWAAVEARLEGKAAKLRSLGEMEETGGEPDVVGRDEATGEVVFADCSAESPKGRRSLCYDGEALEARKKHKPKGSAVETAAEMGIELLTEAEYRELQEVMELDTKTSSWVKTPADVRALGGSGYPRRRPDRGGTSRRRPDNIRA